MYRQAPTVHQFYWARQSPRTCDPLTSGADAEVSATRFCDGCHWISSGWFTRLRVHALRPASVEAGNGAQAQPIGHKKPPRSRDNDELSISLRSAERQEGG